MNKIVQPTKHQTDVTPMVTRFQLWSHDLKFAKTSLIFWSLIDISRSIRWIQIPRFCAFPWPCCFWCLVDLWELKVGSGRWISSFLGINGGPCGDLPYQVGVPTDLSWFINSSSWPTDTKFMKQRTRKACHPPLTQPFWARSIDPGVYIFRHAGWLVHPPWICAKIRVPVVFCGASRHANKSSCICLTPDAASLYCRSARWTDLKMFAVVGFASHLQPIYL